MIPIIEQAEPVDFDAKVRIPGKKWLLNNGNDIPQTKKGGYWTKCKEDVYNAYNGICAYYAYFIEKSSGAVSIDHFKPKSIYRDIAYEWTNFRLACLQANSYKSNYEDVLDPFLLKGDTFFINFSDGSVIVNCNYDQLIQTKASETIQRLRLNDKNLCNKRVGDFDDFIQGYVSLEYLEHRSPFVWYEIKRQKLDKKISI